MTLRQPGATSAKSGVSPRRSVAAFSQQQVLYLDREAVVRPDNAAMHEELQVMEKQQATGSLNVHQHHHHQHHHHHRTPHHAHFPPGGGGGGHHTFPPPSRAGAASRPGDRRSGASSAKFDRVCKGSVVHGLRRAKSGGPALVGGGGRGRGRGQPLGPRPLRGWGGGGGGDASAGGLMVVGDRFAPPPSVSPLLRTQTQFSLSSQRMTVNSPDLYGAFERLPPLEQVRVSLRHMEARSEDAYPTRGASPYSTGTSVGVSGGVLEELKPLVKYSPDVRAQYSRQIKNY